MFSQLRLLKDNFEEAFNNFTRTDVLYPVLNHKELAGMKSRINVILKFVDVCRQRYDGVLMNI